VNDLPLGGLSAATFLRRHWQRAPLLVRRAVADFAGLIDLQGMIALACSDDCESRLILRQAGRWSLEHGPFDRARFRRLPARDWTLLVQGIERFLEPAHALLAKFSFIPHARLDDLMVSYAAPGGGVGPHFDSYDVFLLQGPGRRRWRIGRQRDLSLHPDLPLKILRRFQPQGTAVLDAGDMLYLPPQFAHDGIAVDACFTYSIGFRAPSHRELISEFLAFLEDRLQPQGRYADPGLSLQQAPAEIPAAMILRTGKVLRTIRWNRRDAVEFLGTWLTEPKNLVRFRPPVQPLSPAAFGRAAQARGVALAPASQMLHSGTQLFLNGEPARSTGSALRVLKKLADARALRGRDVPRSPQAGELLYQWYRHGYICLAA